MLGTPYTIETIGKLGIAKDLFQGQLNPQALNYVAFDTRLIHHGKQTIFVALSSEKRDGHDFIEEAKKKGVENFIVSHALPYKDVNYLICDDTLETLQLWAMHHRLQFRCPVIAITGSNGKTIIKEWISTLLQPFMEVVKSPGSYNSQLGVALSLLRIHPKAEVAIIEAGISQKGEMERLWTMIQPDYGILTHMGSAHREGFSSEEEKLLEKLILFEETQQIVIGIQRKCIRDRLRKVLPTAFFLGKEEPSTFSIIEDNNDKLSHSVRLRFKGDTATFTLPGSTEADYENALLAISFAWYFKLKPVQIQEILPKLFPVHMRTEMITDNPALTIINDSYNSDIDSVRNAFQLLQQTKRHPHYHIIMSDLLGQGSESASVHQSLLNEAIALVGEEYVRTIGPIFKEAFRLNRRLSYTNTQSLLKHIQPKDFLHSTVLIKGSRPFSLEQIIPVLNPGMNGSYFQIDLDALAQNFQLLKKNLPPETKTMCMLKAYGYGSGSWEIAQVLAREGATYLAVAYASEGIALRQAKIDLPIMVMNADERSIPSLLSYLIEPQVFSLSFLDKYLRAAHLSSTSRFRIHIKLETGMGRLGFTEADLPMLVERLKDELDLEVVSIMTHLAAADKPDEDPFSMEQIAKFNTMCQYLRDKLGIEPFKHVLNTAGILRFPEYAMDMVRMGIGLYGLSAGVQDSLASQLREIGSLRGSISHIQRYRQGTTIGYGRSESLKRDSVIATISLGYADGIPRNLGNGRAEFLVRGERVPTVGRICMDMFMLDITEIKDARVGDEVVCFGEQEGNFLSIEEVAQWANTIPYELLVRISPRVRRTYLKQAY